MLRQLLLCGALTMCIVTMSSCYTVVMMGVTDAPIGNKIGKAKGLNTTLAKAKMKGNISQVGTWKTEFKWIIIPSFKMEVTGQ